MKIGVAIAHPSCRPIAIRCAQVVVLLALGACQSLPQNEGVPASVSEVVAKIKADVAAYQAYDTATSKEPPAGVCSAAVGFYIESVKVALTTQTDNTVSGSAGATLPVGPVTVGPSIGGSRETKGTQTTTFSLYPRPNNTDAKSVAAAKQINPTDYPIAFSLRQLREGLLDASKQPLAQQACFSLIPPPDADDKPAKDPGGSYVFGFTVIKTAKEDASLKFIIFSVGASGIQQSQAGNTMTVTFKARPGSAAALY